MEELNSIDWSYLEGLSCSTEITELFQTRIIGLVDRFFPVITRKVKSSDDPWITDYIRKLIRLRAKEYRKNGRSLRFKCYDRDIKEEIAKQKKLFFERECAKLTILFCP